MDWRHPGVSQCVSSIRPHPSVRPHACLTIVAIYFVWICDSCFRAQRSVVGITWSGTPPGDPNILFLVFRVVLNP